MKRQDVTKKVAEKTGLEQKAIAEVLKVFLGEIEDGILERKSIQLRPLGTFVVKKRRAKMGRNPFANEPVPVPEHLTVIFRPSRRLKIKLNQKQPKQPKQSEQPGQSSLF
ncbi:MAG: HU family DNA-binding protein [Candidatus Ratteibacteria bacterium]|jgi:nucleoid DNA-binding protein